jgi:hypothetical protein
VNLLPRLTKKIVADSFIDKFLSKTVSGADIAQLPNISMAQTAPKNAVFLFIQVPPEYGLNYKKARPRSWEPCVFPKKNCGKPQNTGKTINLLDLIDL